MKIKVFNRQEAETISHRFIPHVWISITDPGAPPAKIEENHDCKGILRQYFDDITLDFIEQSRARLGTLEDKKAFNLDAYKPMTAEHAKEIIDFVNKYKDEVELICIHCEAGMCRSAGTASALSLWLNGYEGKEVEHTQPQYPNSHVKSLILREINAL